MIELTVQQLFQLYAPLAGLLVLAFWTGGLSQRVKSLEEDVKAAHTKLGEVGGSGERMVRLEVQMEQANAKLHAIERGQAGVQRQLANLVSHPVREFQSGDNG